MQDKATTVFPLPTTCLTIPNLHMASKVAQQQKNLPDNAGDSGLTPGLGRSPGGGNDNPLQYCCLKNFMDRGT